MIYELVLRVGAAQEIVVGGILEELGAIAVTTELGPDPEEVVLRGLFYGMLESSVREIEIRLPLYFARFGLGLPAPVWREVVDCDWEKAWRAHSQAVAVGEGLLVLPSWLEPPVGNRRVVLRVDPAMAFGSGSHPTTRGCLVALERRAHDGLLGRTLDLGCGSGILAIAAAKLGAVSVLATDIDPIATATCIENCGLNQVSGQVITRTQGGVPGGVFDTVVANILANVLLELAPDIVRVLAPGGNLILSGLLETHVEAILGTYDGLGMTGWNVDILEEWAVLGAFRG
ncbi:MAG: 50S ribosomal protein L11 methyltransferase [Magnetococcales bacterium]|nr:50S ribosomal protein L11 methyltransferase [Magnetococcales bacterium]MBF0155777.1 50S ribosomal protein L11 methyltransferase [Magnetococcales bacterium]